MNTIRDMLLRHRTSVVMLFVFLFAFESPAKAYEDSVSQTLKTQIESIFSDQRIEINDYDRQLKEIVVNSEILFVSHDGRYVFGGPIYDTERRVDIVAEREAGSRQALLSSQPQDLFVRYPSTVAQQYQLTVVTDIDCPYCRKLHRAIGDLNSQGVSVNYLMLPRSGVDSASYFKTLNALCSVDPAANITRAMNNKALTETLAECDASQLRQQMQLARDMKINSTPTFILPDGKLQVGLLSETRLMALLDGMAIQGIGHSQ